MGNPPKDAIVRKLIAKYLKFNVDKNKFNSVRKYYLELSQCWEQNGVGSNLCDSIVKKIDIAKENDERDYKKYLQYMKGYPSFFNDLFLKKIPKNNLKGRDKKLCLTFSYKLYGKNTFDV